MTVSQNRWKTVWITGASSGIGKDLAELMDGDVAHVAISARSADKLTAIADSAKTINAYPLDVTDAEATTKTVRDIEAAFGQIDLAVLNAGTWKLMDVADLDMDAVRAGIEVNYMGVMYALKALLPSMMARKSGHIAIVASVAGYRGLPRSIAYGPTKAALINLAETLRAELEPHGITISIVNPGFVDTPMTADNPFDMPGIISSEVAAKALLSGLERKKYEIRFPLMFTFAMKLMRVLPNGVYFWAMRSFIMKSLAH